MSIGITSSQIQTTQVVRQDGRGIIEADFLTSQPRFKYWVGPMLNAFTLGQKPPLPMDARNVPGPIDDYKYTYRADMFLDA